ncbi:hypothetical protein chiPu_0013445 [Chiloscyllium punctatum]|uniref:Uncharacterized protein n=1 Tax=Chiloscyllium punctatum TaxID=137246 RepID=A0A401SX57_CHIPU|nr:hypothetical protein [Chiloscyllium punctatum]
MMPGSRGLAQRELVFDRLEAAPGRALRRAGAIFKKRFLFLTNTMESEAVTEFVGVLPMRTGVNDRVQHSEASGSALVDMLSTWTIANRVMSVKT